MWRVMVLAVVACSSAPPAPAPAAATATAEPVAAIAPLPMYRQIKSEHALEAPTAVAAYALVAGAIHIDDRDVPLAGSGSDPLEAIAHGLARVPPDLRAIIRSLAISPVDNPTDAAWTAKYGMPVKAGMSANADGEVTIYPYGLAELRDESFFVKNLLHELGHAWSLRAWRADKAALDAWLAAIASDPGVPSEYAQGSFRKSGSPAEDAAEATALYFIVRGTPDEARFRAGMPARYALITARFPGH